MARLCFLSASRSSERKGKHKHYNAPRQRGSNLRWTHRSPPVTHQRIIDTTVETELQWIRLTS
jgi:hypothetical protein